MHKGTYADDCIVNRVEQVHIDVELFYENCMSKFAFRTLAQVLHSRNM